MNVHTPPGRVLLRKHAHCLCRGPFLLEGCCCVRVHFRWKSAPSTYEVIYYLLSIGDEYNIITQVTAGKARLKWFDRLTTLMGTWPGIAVSGHSRETHCVHQDIKL